MKKNLVIGLTGGIACGKNTVAEIFQELGADTIDADLIVHQLLKSDLSVKQQVVSTFGESVLDDKGNIDRQKLGRMVFGNPDYLSSLEEIVHPPVIKTISAETKQKLASGGSTAVVVNVPLLIEKNLMHTVDFVVLVHADEDVQVQRLAQRGLSREEALQRIQSQMPSSEKAQFSDFIIYNNGSLSDTAKQAKEIWKALMETICK
jgi:dephospho-CoA kinase